MKRTAFPLLMVLLYLVAIAEPFSRVIGKEGVFSARIMVENTDTGTNVCDSLCPRYWFVRCDNAYFRNTEFDYRITVIKEGSQKGAITVFPPADYYFTDTLSCDSLGFGPMDEYSIDTVSSDTTLIHWNYLHPTKRLTGAVFRKQDESNHLKILVASDSVNDSIVVTRERIELSRVTHHSEIVPRAGTVNPEPLSRTAMYDIRGRKLQHYDNSSIVLVVRGGPAARRPVKKLMLRGK